MPPKFNPPRPSTSTPASAPKSKGRPKGSTNKPKPSPSSGIKKNKSTSTTNGKTKGVNWKKGGERPSAASVRSLLPSLSPDTEEEISGFEEEDIEIEIGNDSDDPFASQPRARREAEDVHALELDERKEKIPDDLLAVVLSRMFRQEGSRMSRDAVRAVGKYVDTFLREGVARAAWAGEEGRRNGGEFAFFFFFWWVRVLEGVLSGSQWERRGREWTGEANC